MTKVPVLLAGIFVLLLCVRLLAQMLSKDDRPVTADDFFEAREALDSFLIKTATIQRILSNDDLAFVSSAGSPELRRLFMKERKMLALEWLRTIRSQVACLRQIHLRLAARLSPTPAHELQLSLQYGVFVLVSDSLLVLFWLFGPFKTKRVITYFVPRVETVFTALKVRLAAIDPSHLGSRESLLH